MLLDKAEAQKAIWLKTYTTRRCRCCGCGEDKQVYAIVYDINGRKENGRYIGSCRAEGKHNVCGICLTCTKELGFEW